MISSSLSGIIRIRIRRKVLSHPSLNNCLLEENKNIERHRVETSVK